jgi:hypothetical protein
MRRGFVAVVVVAVAAAVCAGEEAASLEERWRAFRTDIDGASYTTRQRALQRLRDDLLLRDVTLRATVERTGSFTLAPGSGDGRNERFRALLSWEHEGISVPPRGCEGRSDADTAQIAGERLRSWLPGGEDVGMVVVRGEEINLTLLFTDDAVMDRLRIGQRVAVRARLFGLFGESFFGILDGVLTVDE